MFGHIIDNPLAPTTTQDLELLNTAIAYFNSMKQITSLSAVSSKLERTALVFYDLARFITSGEHATGDVQDLQPMASATSSGESTAVETSPEEPALFDVDGSSAQAEFEAYTDAFIAYIKNQDRIAQSSFDSTDIENVLDCLGSDDPSTRKRKRSFESSLDWFSWDAYYCKE